MIEVLCDQKYADVSVMAGFRKHVTHLLGIYVVQQIVEDHEEQLAARVFKICRDALVKMYVPLRQFCRPGSRRLLACSTRSPRGRNPVPYARSRGSAQTVERRHARTARSTYYAREPILKFKVITHG